MADLSVHVWRWCAENESFSQDIPGSKGKSYRVVYGKTPNGPYLYGWSCTCQSFRYRGRCKHIEACKPLRCTYGQDAVMGSPSEMGGTCPQCGGPTRPISVGV